MAVLLAVLVLSLWLASDDRKQPALAPGSSNHLELSDVCSQVCSWSWKAFRCSAGCRIRVHLPMLQGSCTLHNVKASVRQKSSLCGSSSSGVAELSDTSGANSAPAPFSKAAKLRGGAAAVTPTQLVQSFVAATERGDAVAALKLVTDDFLFKTYRATTDSLAAAEARLQKKFPAPTKVTPALFPPVIMHLSRSPRAVPPSPLAIAPSPTPSPVSTCLIPAQVTTALYEVSPTVLVREIVVKPVPFITVTLRQEFEVRKVGGGLRLFRAEYIKL